MKSLLIALAVVALATGCQRSAPQWETLSPFGEMRVPPPSTGGYGQPNNYYQYQSPALPAGTPSFEVGNKPGTSLSHNGIIGSEANIQVATNVPTPAGTASSNEAGFRTVADGSSAVQMATHAEAASAVAPSLGQVQQTSAIITPSRAGGMAVTDLTRSAEPALFRPPPDLIEISKPPGGTVSTAASVSTATTVAPVAPAPLAPLAPLAPRPPAQFPEHEQPVGTGLNWRVPQ